MNSRRNYRSLFVHCPWSGLDKQEGERVYRATHPPSGASNQHRTQAALNSTHDTMWVFSCYRHWFLLHKCQTRARRADSRKTNESLSCAAAAASASQRFQKNINNRQQQHRSLCRARQRIKPLHARAVEGILCSLPRHQAVFVLIFMSDRLELT